MEPADARSGVGRAELPATYQDAGCGCTRMHRRAPGRAQPCGHLYPDPSLIVFMGPDSSRKGLVTKEPGDVLVQPARPPRDGHRHQSRSLLLAAMHGPGDMAEPGPTAGHVAPTAWGTVTTGHGEAWCRAGAAGDGGGCGGRGVGGQRQRWPLGCCWGLWPSLQLWLVALGGSHASGQLLLRGP